MHQPESRYLFQKLSVRDNDLPDIVLAIGANINLGQTHFNTQVKAFAKRFVDSFDVSATGVRIGIAVKCLFWFTLY